MTVAGYIFLVEHDPTIPDLNRQQADLQSYAEQLGVKVDFYSVEKDITIKRPFGKRLEGAKILGELATGDILLTGRAEWVFSSAKDGLDLLLQLEEKGVALYCRELNENVSIPEERRLVVSEGKAEFTKKLLKALAVCESSKHGESIKAAKRKMAKEGRYIGGPVPYGWKVKGGFLKKDNEQQKVIGQIKKWRADRWSYRDIAAKLREELGVRLSHEGIRKVLLKDDAGAGKRAENT